MATIQENLDLLQSTKSAIKNAIIEKGVSVSDSDSFASYADKISEIQTENINISSGTIKFSNSTFTEVPSGFIGWENLTDGSYMFASCSGLTSFNYNLPNLTNGTNMFNYCISLSSWNIDLPNLNDGISMFRNTKIQTWNIDLPNLTNATQMLQHCNLLTTFTSDLSNLTNGIQMFNDCPALQNITLTGSLNCDGFDLTACEILTVDSLVNVISVLVDLTGESPKTLKLGSTNLAKLSEEQKAVATNKNWVLS